MKKIRSLLRYFNLYTIIMIIITASIVTGVWALLESRDYRDTFENEQKILIENKRLEVQTIVQDAENYVRLERENWEAELQALLTQRVNEAVNVADNLYSMYRNSLQDQEIMEIIKEALRPIRFNSERGYYFMVALDGTELLYPVAPDFEGQNLIGLTDSQGTFVIKKEIEVIKSRGEGFVRDYWMKPGGNLPSEKLTYIKVFSPLNVYIGTGEYLEDFEMDIQGRIARTLSLIRINSDEYIFGGRWDGVTIIGPAAGRNNWDIQDTDGKYVVRELVEAAKRGQGFVSYQIPEGIGQPAIKKTSYVTGIPDWQWYVGAGFDETKIINYIEQRRNELGNQYRNRITLIAFLFTGLLILNFFVIRYFSRRIDNNYSQFQRFFENAGAGLVPIEKEKLTYREFYILADSANKMIRILQEARDEIKTRLNEKESLLQEIHHRVKNNLQIISSLLNLQKDGISSSEDRKKFQESIDRIRVMATIHEQLYESADLSSLNIRIFLTHMIRDLIFAYADRQNAPEVIISAEDIFLGADKTIPLGLIVSELITNCLKYSGNTGSNLKIEMSLKKQGGGISIVLSDNGTGPPADFDPENSSSLGLQLVYSLTAQLEGTVTWDPGPGLVWIFQIPVY